MIRKTEPLFQEAGEMSLSIYNSVDEQDVASAIASRNLSLALILQECLPNEKAVQSLINDMEVLGGTNEAGKLALMFAQAMIDA